MYPGGEAGRTARRLAHLWAHVFASGVMPRRWVTLEVTGRRSGRPVRFPLGLADYRDDWYLVSMLGDRCNWVRNVRAADGHATLRGRGRRRGSACRLVEVTAPSEKAPVIKRYLAVVPGGRPHLPVDPNAPLSEFEAAAERVPVFRVAPEQ